MYHFKILVPSIASGAIIGKGGETIAQLQKDTNARVKMSKANDFYPGNKTNLYKTVEFSQFLLLNYVIWYLPEFRRQIICSVIVASNRQLINMKFTCIFYCVVMWIIIYI